MKAMIQRKKVKKKGGERQSIGENKEGKGCPIYDDGKKLNFGW